MILRRPNRLEMAIQAILALYALMNGSEFISALGAHSCAEDVSADCYPWAAEGPSAGYWNYETKAHYLASTVAGILVAVIAMAVPFFTARPIWGVIGMVATSVGGMRLAGWLMPMMLA